MHVPHVLSSVEQGSLLTFEQSGESVQSAVVKDELNIDKLAINLFGLFEAVESCVDNKFDLEKEDANALTWVAVSAVVLASR